MSDQVGDPIAVLYAGGGPDNGRAQDGIGALESDSASHTVRAISATADVRSALPTAVVDCVVVEYDAPDIDGPALLETIGEDCPVVAVFDDGDGSREARALAGDVNRSLRRPPDSTQWPSVLVEHVKNAVEQQRLAERSDDAEERYRSLFENNPHIMWEEDYSASKRRLDDIAASVDDLEAYFDAHPEVVRELMADIEIIDVNENALEYYDAPSKSVLLDNLDTVFTDSAYEAARGMWLAIADGETTYRWETVGQTLSGKRMHEIIEMNVPEAYADDFSRVYVTAMDITDRKHQQQELQRQRDRLDEFAGVASHDLRNPLSVAEGHLELAMAECESPHLESVASAHDRMRTLIDDLLTLARDGRSVDDPEQVSLSAVVDSCRSTVDMEDATLVVDTDRTVHADEMRLKQLFENLLRNAVEHGSTSSQNAMGSDDAVDHGATSPDSHARDGTAANGGPALTIGDIDEPGRQGFYVEDDGAGIAPEERDAVLEAGYTTAEDGTGFGLAIVRQVVDAHGWELTITDGERGGARFEITGVGSNLVS